MTKKFWRVFGSQFQLLFTCKTRMLSFTRQCRHIIQVKWKTSTFLCNKFTQNNRAYVKKCIRINRLRFVEDMTENMLVCFFRSTVYVYCMQLLIVCQPFNKRLLLCMYVSFQLSDICWCHVMSCQDSNTSVPCGVQKSFRASFVCDGLPNQRYCTYRPTCISRFVCYSQLTYNAFRTVWCNSDIIVLGLSLTAAGANL